MTQEQKEQKYREHVENTDETGVHVDGCYYCGGNHPSDCCTSIERNLYWEDEED